MTVLLKTSFLIKDPKIKLDLFLVHQQTTGLMTNTQTGQSSTSAHSPKNVATLLRNYDLVSDSYLYLIITHLYLLIMKCFTYLKDTNLKFFVIIR